MKRILCILLLVAASVSSLLAQALPLADGATVKDKTLYHIQSGQLKEVKDNFKLPFDVEVTTNNTFKIGKGKERTITDGQIIRADGWITSPDGSIEPVMDHLIMKEGRVYVVRDGQASALTESMSFPNGSIITPDGYYTRPGGLRVRLLDGRLFKMDGTYLQSMDAATLINGRVMMQKDGSLIPLNPISTMGMNDGTQVKGDGTIQKHDGSTFKLAEGQTILIEGPVFDH